MTASRWFALMALLLTGWNPLSAQTRVEELHGAVYDASGRSIPGAVVIVLDEYAQRVSQVATGPDGHWRVRVGRAGALSLEIVADGFRTVRSPVDEAARGGAAIVTTLAVAPRSEQIVVTATADNAPLEVLMDPRQPRQPVPAHDGAEYLDTIAGFSTVRKGGSGADPVLRGMAGSRLAILADGAGLLGGCSNRMDPPTAYVFPETYDIVTVVKGPQTVKYGAAASAGTVLFERVNERLAAPSWQANGGVTAGAWGRNDQVFDLRAGTPDFYVRGVGSRSSMGNYRDGAGEAVHSEYMRWNMDTAVGWTPDATTRLEVASQLSDGHAAYADRAVDGSKFRRTGAGVTFEKRRPGARLSRIDVSSSYNYVDHVMDNYTLRAPASAMTMPTAMNPSRTTWNGRAMTTWTIRRATLEAGMDVQANEHRSRNTMRQDLTPYDTLPWRDDARFVSAGVFGELDYRASDRTRVVGGARLDRATGRDLRTSVALSMMDMRPNPTANLHRTDLLGSGFARVEQGLASAPVTLYAGVGHTSRFPDFWELATTESESSLSAFGTRPEKTTQLDAGVRLSRASTSASVSLYANTIQDYILIQTNYAKPAMMGTRAATITRNVDARTLGGELGVTQRIGAAWTVDGTMAYVRGTNETDRLPLAQLPPLEARLNVQYQRDRWSIGGLARVVSAQDRIALNQGTIVGRDFAATDGFSVISLNAGWKPAATLLVTAGVDNLLNEVYAEHISRQGAAIPGFALQTGQVREPGRTAWVRVSVRR
ncbi:MAG: TonB-dependent copper receptor [Acidobacteria bacterium]|nr:TonB-dependent copper receptor [Acidobacteriota bacterium]